MQKKSKLMIAGLASLAMAAGAHAGVKYIGTPGGTASSIVDLSGPSVDGVAYTEATFEANFGGDYTDAATNFGNGKPQVATWQLTTADQYVLEDIVAITKGDLIIDAGVIIRGQPRTSSSVFDAGALLVAAGSKIIAAGEATNPIVFTTASTTGGATGGRASGRGSRSPSRAILMTARSVRSAERTGRSSSMRRRTASEEDLAQEVFLKMFTRMDQFQGAVPFTHWVSRIALTTCIDHLRQHAFVGEGRHEALALPVVGGAFGQWRRGVSPVVDVLLHALEPVRHPPAPALDERDPQLRVLLEHPTADEAEARHLVLVRVRDHMQEEIVVVTIEARLGHVLRGGLVEHDRYAELLDEGPQRIERRVVECASADGVGSHHHRREPKLADCPLGLAHGRTHVHLWDDRGGPQAVAVGRAVVVDPVVVRTAEHLDDI